MRELVFELRTKAMGLALSLGGDFPYFWALPPYELGEMIKAHNEAVKRFGQ